MTRLLIADDHPFIIAGLEAILRDSGFDVIATCADGRAVLDAVPLHRPDLLLIDVMMPILTGIEAIRALRDRGHLVPVVLLTASLDHRRLAKALELQVEGIVLKESAQSRLLECLEAVRDGGRWIEPALVDLAATAASSEGNLKSRLDCLAPSERAVVKLVALGLRNRQIAIRLGRTEGTIKVYLHRIYEKTGVGNRTELAMLAKTSGIESSRIETS